MLNRPDAGDTIRGTRDDTGKYGDDAPVRVGALARVLALDPELLEVWPLLDEPIQAAIVALARTKRRE